MMIIIKNNNNLQNKIELIEKCSNIIWVPLTKQRNLYLILWGNIIQQKESIKRRELGLIFIFTALSIISEF